mmetsp:Transcript_25749/g.58626  ORF Transcript_25749/g.58626 Transcript_25749/m.58626 type:complete len:781 (-) Transcript_25749:124-2466(-)
MTDPSDASLQVARLTALLRAKDLENERLAAEIAVATEARMLAQRQLEDVLALGRRQATEYYRVLEQATTNESTVMGNCDESELSNPRAGLPQPSQGCPISTSGLHVLQNDDILQRILPSFSPGWGFPSIEGSNLACLCRGMPTCKGTVIKLGSSHPPTSWNAVQFSVDDPNHFVIVVKTSGYWGTNDSFRLGIAPTSMPLDGECGCKCGYWLSPKSGYLIGQDGSNHVMASLVADQSLPRTCFRDVKGAQRGKEQGKWKGKGKSEPRARFRDAKGVQRGKGKGNGKPASGATAFLVAGSVWVLHYRHGCLEFLFAESDRGPLESLGPAQFACTRTKQNPGMCRLPSPADGFVPSLLCRCPVRQGPATIISSAGSRREVHEQPFAVVTVMHAASPAPGVENLSLVGHSFEDLGWCRPYCHLTLPRYSVQALSRSSTELNLAHFAFQRWKCCVAAVVNVLRGSQGLQCIGHAGFALSHSVPRGEHWVRIPFDVDNPHEFKLAVRVEGHWLKRDEFLIGLEPIDSDNSFDPSDTSSRPCFRANPGRGKGRGRDSMRLHPIREKVNGEYLFNPRTGKVQEWCYLPACYDPLWGWGKGRGSCRRDVGCSGRGLYPNLIWSIKRIRGKVHFDLFDGFFERTLGVAFIQGEPVDEVQERDDFGQEQPFENDELAWGQNQEEEGDEVQEEEHDFSDNASEGEVDHDWYDYRERDYNDGFYHEDGPEEDPCAPAPQVPFCQAGYRPVLWILRHPGNKEHETTHHCHKRGRGPRPFRPSTAGLRVAVRSP